MRLCLAVLTVVAVAVSGLTGLAETALATTGQVYAAGAAATNLPTESTWPGAQSYPYVCCWSSQGQYVTFTFTARAGSNDLVLRYSAGAGDASRKLDVDGAVAVANQTFAGTGDWSTWSTVTLTRTLTAGSHTLKVWYDAAAGSHQYINLDNLTVDQGTSGPPPGGVRVSAGYADTTAGITPWQGSPNTVFIGEAARCCSTHGSNNGSATYDGGALEVANTSLSPFTVDAVTVDLGGNSSPGHFDLWGGGGSGRLPVTLSPGQQVVMTMTNGFNFDTSDPFGEGCHVNTGVVPVVNVTVNGTTVAYDDRHQILNTDGVDLSSCPGSVDEQHPFALLSATAQAAAPVDDVAPVITGPAVQSRVLSGLAGGWDASPPPVLSAQWARCNSSGSGCSSIPGATSWTYVPSATDVGSTLRLQVTATNASGAPSVSSATTAVIVAGPALLQLGDTSPGFTSTFVTGSGQLGSVFTAALSGTSSDFEFFARGAGSTQQFTPRVYSVVNGQRGSLLQTGAAVSVPRATSGQWYTSGLAGLRLVAGSAYYLALDSAGAYNGTYVGAEMGGTNAFFLDYSQGGGAGGGKVYAAGAAATNLPTESTWPGAQSYPYVCCWNAQGQYVTFAFTVPAGSTALVLRYSAGGGGASRKVQVDGAVSVANETFPSTANWSTWSTVMLTRTLTAGSHTLKVWYDASAGSHQYINLDNLSVNPG